MSYFHTGIRTIIGAKSFHGPVRDGKGWDHLAMVVRRNWLPGKRALRALWAWVAGLAGPIRSVESGVQIDCATDF